MKYKEFNPKTGAIGFVDTGKKIISDSISLILHAPTSDDYFKDKVLTPDNRQHVNINKDGIVSLNLKNKSAQDKFMGQVEKLKDFKCK